MKILPALLVVAALIAGLSAGGSALAAGAGSLPRGGIINCSSPGDSEDWLNAKRMLANELWRDGVRFSWIERAVGCLVATVWDRDGHTHFQYYDPQSLRRVR